jgi:hypothetical protein
LLDELCFLPEPLLAEMEDEDFPSASFSFVLDDDLDFSDIEELEEAFAPELFPNFALERRSDSAAELELDFEFELDTCLELLEESSGTLEEISISSGLSDKSTAIPEASSSPQAERSKTREKTRIDPTRLITKDSIEFNNTIIS